MQYAKMTQTLRAIVRGKSILKLHVRVKPNARDSN